MSAHQMVCHLDDSYKCGLGEKYASPATGFLQRTLLKWLALEMPLPWTKGVPTRPEMEQGKGGSLPLDFRQDVALLALHPGPVLRCLAQALCAAPDLPRNDSGGLDAVGISARRSSPSPVWPMNAAPAVPSVRHPRRVAYAGPILLRGILPRSSGAGPPLAPPVTHSGARPARSSLRACLLVDRRFSLALACALHVSPSRHQPAALRSKPG